MTEATEVKLRMPETAVRSEAAHITTAWSIAIVPRVYGDRGMKSCTPECHV